MTTGLSRAVNRRVVLIYPRTGQDVYGVNVGLPIGLLTLAGCLRSAGYEPTLLDERVSPDWADRLARTLSPPPLLVGISAMTGPQLGFGLAAARQIRAAAPDVPLIWGGVHPSLLPESTARHPLVDAVAVGEGEATIVELARAVESGAPLESVAGLVLRQGDRIVTTPARPGPTELEGLPPLPYDLVDMADYTTIAHTLRTPQLQLATSRGCPFRCGYCYNRQFNRHPYRCWSAERTCAEIERLHHDHGARCFFFYDDYFFGDRGRVEALLDRLEAARLGVTFEVSCRIDFIDRAEPAFLHRLARAGFRELLIGVESGNDEILRLIHKDITVEQILRANRKLAESGINCKYSFMAGFPGERNDQVLDTVRLMRRLLRENPNASLTPLGIYVPYPGTELFERYQADCPSPLPDTLEDWADCNWDSARRLSGDRGRVRFLNRLNILSRFFDRHAFERFGHRSWRPLVMAGYAVYSRYVDFRLRREWFGLMPEAALLNRLQQAWVNRAHRTLLQNRPPTASDPPPGPSAARSTPVRP